MIINFLRKERERRFHEREISSAKDEQTNDYLPEGEKEKEELKDFNSKYTTRRLPATSMEKELPHAIWSIHPDSDKKRKFIEQIKPLEKPTEEVTEPYYTPTVQTHREESIDHDEEPNDHDKKEKPKLTSQQISFNKDSLNEYFYKYLMPGDIKKTGSFDDNEIVLVTLTLNVYDFYRENWGLFAMCIPSRVGYQCSNCVRTRINDIKDCWEYLKTKPAQVKSNLFTMKSQIEHCKGKINSIVDQGIYERMLLQLNKAQINLDSFLQSDFEQWELAFSKKFEYDPSHIAQAIDENPERYTDESGLFPEEYFSLIGADESDSDDDDANDPDYNDEEEEACENEYEISDDDW